MFLQKYLEIILEKNNWIHQTFGKDAGPSLNFIHPDYKGKFGVIAPYSKDFCKTCNRLRITSEATYDYVCLEILELVSDTCCKMIVKKMNL